MLRWSIKKKKMDDPNEYLLIISFRIRQIIHFRSPQPFIWCDESLCDCLCSSSVLELIHIITLFVIDKNPYIMMMCEKLLLLSINNKSIFLYIYCFCLPSLFVFRWLYSSNSSRIFNFSSRSCVSCGISKE